MTTVPAHGQSIPAINEERIAWLALAMTPKLGPRRILRAVEQARAATKILEMRLTELEGLQFPAESAQFIADGHARVAADQQMDELMKTGGSILPMRTRFILNACARSSILLLCCGCAAVPSCWRIHRLRWWARVIPRLMDRVWRRCCRDLAHRGLIILSGMARGIDTCAHKSALAAQRPTIAIWGTGINVIYPRRTSR